MLYYEVGGFIFVVVLQHAIPLTVFEVYRHLKSALFVPLQDGTIGSAPRGDWKSHCTR